MFRIYDGRDEFYQWDVDRKLIVEDASVNQVHFCNRSSDCSLVCEVRTEDGLRVVDVPNIILQSDWKVRAYAYDVNYTKHENVFKIIASTKPEDYVYTETEVLNYNTLLERINDIDENIGQVVEDYLAENPIEVDLSGYATKEDLETIELTPGPAGEPGYTPVKGVDYFDGEPGKDGETPVKGTDYWTEEDKNEIVDDVLANIEIPEGGDADIVPYGFAPGAFLKSLVMNDLGNSSTINSDIPDEERLKLLEQGHVVKWGEISKGSITLAEKATVVYVYQDGTTYKKTNQTVLNFDVSAYQTIAIKLGYNNYIVGSSNSITKYFQGLFYDNTTSGLAAKTLPGAIDELKTLIDNIGTNTLPAAEEVSV